jgi:dihydropteroate synthase
LAGRGAHIVRVHDVGAIAKVLAVVDAIRSAG